MTLTILPPGHSHEVIFFLMSWWSMCHRGGCSCSCLSQVLLYSNIVESVIDTEYSSLWLSPQKPHHVVVDGPMWGVQTCEIACPGACRHTLAWWPRWHPLADHSRWKGISMFISILSDASSVVYGNVHLHLGHVVKEIDWLIDWLIDRLIDWLIYLFIHSFIHWYLARL